jgi:hypothetical protein
VFDLDSSTLDVRARTGSRPRARRLFRPLVGATTAFFQAQRDGHDVIPGRLDRKPSHLADHTGIVYAEPKFRR